MKKIVPIFALLLVGISCSDENQFQDIKEIENYYMKNLSSDKNFIQLINEVSELSEFKIKNQSSAEEFRAALNSGDQNLRLTLGQYFENPDRIQEKFEKINKINTSFWEENNNFYLLDIETRSKILENATLEVIQEKKISLSNLNGARTSGECEAQLAVDKETCLQDALLQGALCGLLAPTLAGAVFCYATVMAVDVLCHDNADRTYSVCKQFAD